MRFCILAHLIAVAFCAIFSLADRDLFISPPASAFTNGTLSFLLLPSVAAMFVCPMIALSISIRKWRSKTTIGFGLFAEVLVTAAHLLAILPACS
jgi:hypothetical protein